jgi:hypothetical protein
MEENVGSYFMLDKVEEDVFSCYFCYFGDFVFCFMAIFCAMVAYFDCIILIEVLTLIALIR